MLSGLNEWRRTEGESRRKETQFAKGVSGDSIQIFCVLG